MMAIPKMEQIGKWGWGSTHQSRSEAGKKSTWGIAMKDEVREAGRMVWSLMVMLRNVLSFQAFWEIKERI